MGYDTSAPLISYKNLLLNYRDKVRTVVSDLNVKFNFGLASDNSSYEDFWAPILYVGNLKYYNFSDKFASIQTKSQTLNDNIEKRYMDYVGMMMSLDEYVCFASDAFSRIVDSIWSFGDGQIYMNKTGELLPDGSYNIIRKGLQYYQDSISGIISEMEDYVSHDPGPTAPASMYGMSPAQFKNNVYLTYKLNNYFVPQVQKISELLEEANKEILALDSYLDMISNALNIWFIESFKIVSYTSLAFNLSKKAESVANKIITVNTGVTTTSIIAVNQAKYWKKQVLPDQSNRYQCLIGAIEAGLTAITYPSMLESFIDESWKFIVPKYG